MHEFALPTIEEAISFFLKLETSERAFELKMKGSDSLNHSNTAECHATD